MAKDTLKTAEGTGPAGTQGGDDIANVDTRHPQYIDYADEWRLMRDAVRGTKAIKEEGTVYLPMPNGFREQPDKGLAMYNAYKQRGSYPEITGPTIQGMVGIVHKREAQIEMPEAMMPLWESCTKDGTTLEALHRDITEQLLTTGRCALLVDARLEATGGSDLPYFTLYKAEDLINWSEQRDFFVLDEAYLERHGFRWQEEPQWRVLELVEGVYTIRVYKGASRALATEAEGNARGGKKLDKIPLTVINDKNLSTDVSNPPLTSIARAAETMYRLDCDYKHQLFMSGQETLFTFNVDAPSAVGAGVVVSVTGISKDSATPDAKYVGPDCKGIEAHRLAIQDEKDSAAKAGARMFESGTGTGAESGASRKLRFSSETASLATVSIASAAGLEKALKDIAVMMGMNPDDISVTPNLEFFDMTLTPEEAKALVESWQNGGFSYETLYANLQRGGIASAERSAEEELALMDEESEEDEQIPVDPRTGLPIQPVIPPQNVPPQPDPENIDG